MDLFKNDESGIAKIKFSLPLFYLNMTFADKTNFIPLKV